MSDSDSYSDSDQPPALEDADIEDVSSNASVVSDSSDSVSIATEGSEFSEEPDDNTLGKPFVVPLKLNDGDMSVSQSNLRVPLTLEEKEVALERNAMRRQASNEMLGAMRAASISMAENDEGAAHGGDGPRRRPPPRTKSGDGLKGADRRRPPPRTKSGEGLKARDDFVRKLQVEDEDDEDAPKGKDQILKRNAARRQKSSDMLSAMRDSTRRGAPSRSKSSGAALQRRAPARTKSGAGPPVEGGDDPKPRRRPPARTKSGDGLSRSGPGERERRAPPRTKSGDGLSRNGPPRRRPPAKTES